ncbi:hypothetical protein MHH49_17920 [Paenibacillus sp. FSL F4-0122]|uniref:hypothetical protein n=1 Tax=Paenibacillus TaxID=44249 RepID=UPI001595D9C4|nr:hypothetical protein [Paenibacillus odorifer]
MLKGILLNSGQESSDPMKATAAVIKVVETSKPPLQLLLGKNAYQAARHKFTSMIAGME